MMAAIRHRANSPPPKKKRNAEPRQNSKYRQSVIDPLVNPGSPPHRHQARPKADPTRTHHCMVTLAQSSPGRRSTCPLQNTTTVMLEGSSSETEFLLPLPQGFPTVSCQRREQVADD